MQHLRGFLAVGAAVLVVLAPARCRAQKPGVDPQKVAGLIDQFRGLDFGKREKAAADLFGLLPQFNAENFKQLRDATADKDPEVARRVERVLQLFTYSANDNPTVRRLLNEVKVTVGPPGLFLTSFALDGFVGDTRNNNPVLAGLQTRYQAIRNSVAGGNFDKLTTEMKFDQLRGYISNLTPDQFNSLGLGRDGKPATQGQVVGEIDAAIKTIGPAINELGRNSAGALPPPRSDTAVAAAGGVPLGAGLGLQLRAVAVAGGIDSFDPQPDLALATLPPGLQSVGHLYDLLATRGLEVAGRVGVSIEYGDVQLVGNPALDPAQLGLVRLANGGFEPLQDVVNDLGTHTITGFYDTPSAAGGLDQFGEFVVVQAVPEPPAALLLGAGAAALLGAAATRRAPGRVARDPA